MESSGKILVRVNRLVHKLIKLVERLKRENRVLLAERDRLIGEKERLTTLVERYRRAEKANIIYATLLESDSDKLRAKRQVENILREIDSCIDTLKGRE